MELTGEQTNNLVSAIRTYKTIKKRYEAAQKDLAGALEKLKTCCQGNGSEQQVMQTANDLLAAAYLKSLEVGL